MTLQNLLDYTLIFLIISIISIMANYIGIWIARRIDLIDYPGSALHKGHETPTPLSGGLAIVLAFVFYLILKHQWISEKWMGIIAAAFIIFLFGLWDDVFSFKYEIKLMGQVLGALVLIASGSYIQIFNQTQYIWINWVVTLLWVVGIVNAFNFMDSMDSIVIGLSLIGFLSLMIIFLIKESPFLTEISLVFFGISLVAYFFNRTPARMFLGDSGAQILGFFLSVLCIKLIKRNLEDLPSLITPVLLMGVPIFNMVLVVFSRLRRKVPIYRARLDQTYNRLITIGLSKQKSVILIHIASLMLSVTAILTLIISHHAVYFLFMSLVMIGVSLMILLERKGFKNEFGN